VSQAGQPRTAVLDPPSAESLGGSDLWAVPVEATVGADLPRVLMILKRPHGLRGMQQQALRVTQALRARGAEVSILGHSRRFSRPPGHWDPSIPVEYVVTPGQLRFVVELSRRLIRQADEYDVVHVHGFGAEALAALLARRRTGRPVVVKPSTAGPGTKLHRHATLARVLPLGPRWLWRQVDAWVCISEQTRADVLRLGVREARVHRIPNGADTAIWRPLPPAERQALRTRLGLQPTDRVVVTAAQLLPRKRVDLMVRAWLALAPTHPQLHLWVLGKGEQLEELRALCAAAPGGERVWLPGRIKPPQVLERFQAADLFGLLSLWEGLPNALLEAMACGLPALATGVSGMEDVVRHEQTGLLAPVDDQPAVEAALRRLVSDDAFRQQLGDQAAQFIVEQYSMESTAAQLLTLYQQLRGQRGTR